MSLESSTSVKYHLPYHTQVLENMKYRRVLKPCLVFLCVFVLFVCVFLQLARGAQAAKDELNTQLDVVLEAGLKEGVVAPKAAAAAAAVMAQ